MNDVLRTLREARPAELNPDATVDADARRAELARAMAADVDPATPGKAMRRRVRPMWGLGLAGAVAAGALVAATLVAPGGDEPGANRAGGGPGAEKTLDAKTVLLAAAEKANGQTDTPRAYWHHVAIASHTYTVGKAGARYAIVTRDRQETWTPSEPGGKAWNGRQYLGAKPATAADAEAWRSAGSPGGFDVRVPISPGSTITKPFTVEVEPGPVEIRPSTPAEGGKVFWLGRNVTMKDLRSLPSDAARLKAELMRWYEGHGTEGDVPARPGEWLYGVAQGLVMDMPVRPEVRAAAFRMLAGLPSVKSIGEVTDPEGRTGNAIAVDKETPRGVIRHRMIIDLSIGTALASQNIMLKPASGEEVPAGRAMNSVVTISAEWTDSPPR
ncbi:CU044_5270 family protein [Spirillospora sp. NPDC048819]|uniref:CU044_5270 family protein n=1 Tax=Spirillospora sp. NPDC048819 TaxID=3155268 RepID=UPI0033D3BD78